MSDASFGGRLRDARVAAGLTQAELGAPKFSRSYVSLLESGSRQPTREVVAHVAERLQLDPGAIEEWIASGQDEGAVELAALQVESVFRLAAHSRSDARELIRGLERADMEANSPLAEMRSSLHSLFQDSRVPLPESLQSLGALMDHRAVRSSPRLYGYVLEQRCYLLRLGGRLVDAIAVAEEGLSWLQSSEGGEPFALSAYIPWVSSLAELGRDDEAVRLIPELRDALDAAPAGIAVGNGRWALGNLCMMAGDGAAGVAEHDRAGQLISPDRHLRQWARLQRASAAMRLNCDVALETVGGLLDLAGRAFSLSADAADLVELDYVRGRHALVGGDPAEASRLAALVLERAQLLPPQGQAEAAELAGEALMELGERERAIAQFQSAVAIYQDIKAYERAFTLCARWGFAPAPATASA